MNLTRRDVLKGLAALGLVAPTAALHGAATAQAQGLHPPWFWDSPARAGLRRKLIVQWPLTEASGTRLSTFGNYPLTDNNSVGQATGLVQPTAAHFTNASHQYLSTPSVAVLQMGPARNFTVAAWCYLDANSGISRHMVSKISQPASNAFEYILWFRNTQRFTFGIGTGVTAQQLQADTFGLPPTGQWMLVIGWHNASDVTINIQVNNGTINSAARTVTPATNTNSVYLGSAGGLQDWWDGRQGPVWLFGDVLTGAERAYLWNGGRGRLVV